MPSLKGYVSYSTRRTRIVIHNPGLALRILPGFFPRSIRTRNKVANDLIRGLSKKLSFENATARFSGMRYVLVDEESLTIVSPEFEEEIWSYFKVRRDEVIIDVGAHIGKYSFLLSRVVGPRGLVIAFEPFPKNYRALLKGIELNQLKNVMPFNMACWNEKAELVFYVGDVCGHGSLKTDQGLGKMKVEATRIDDVVSSLNVKKVDWIKIDVQGSEYEVLEGSEGVLKNFKPKVISEVYCRNADKVFSFMKKKGYNQPKTILCPEAWSPTDAGYFYFEPIL